MSETSGRKEHTKTYLGPPEPNPELGFQIYLRGKYGGRDDEGGGSFRRLPLPPSRLKKTN